MLSKLRLRHKLALSLVLAALLPVVVAATVAVRIVLRGLEDGLREQTTRQLRVGMNLVLRNVERLGGDAERLASTPALVDALKAGERAQVEEVLAREDTYLPSALIQIIDARGNVVAWRPTGDNRDANVVLASRYPMLTSFFGVLRRDNTAPMVQRGLAYERRVTLTREGEAGWPFRRYQPVLVVHAVAPIVDPSSALLGVVLVSMPFDGDFADGIKAALGTDVLIHSGDSVAMSSFQDGVGGRLEGIKPPGELVDDVLAGGTRQGRGDIGGSDYSLGYAPLKDIEGAHVGMFGVAVGRGALARAKTAAARSLGLGAAGAIVFALGLAGLLSRRLTRPIARLHEGALAIARGELSARMPPVDAPQGDEIGDLATAFTNMTASLQENQDRLAARMREIVALHEAGRAVSSVLGLEEVLRKVVDSVARVLDTRLAALWLVDTPALTGAPPLLRIGAARAKPGTDLKKTMRGEAAEKVADPLIAVAAEVARRRLPLRVDDVDESPSWREAARGAHIDGSLLGVPLERGQQVVGVLVVGRGAGSPAFSDADENLLATFADQAAAAIENSRLYEEVRAFSGELEQKVRLRTAELTVMNAELGRALHELQEAQSQLILSERMAGLGALVAGVAHEINSPSAAIRGSVDALADNVQRLARHARELGELRMDEEARKTFFADVEEVAPRVAERRMGSPADVRRRARALAQRMTDAGIAHCEPAARALAELTAEEAVERLLPHFKAQPRAVDTFAGYVREYIYLHRNVGAIQGAIKQIQRIVGALKSYSHLDQAKVEQADIHEGIENTLVILHHELKYGIHIVRRYAQLPSIPVFVDELNQVWTNLIHNAVQALGGKGEIVIETAAPPENESENGMVAVRVIDDGPGIAAEVLPRIFEPFFTTKAKGEGTGLGLGIVKQIIDKHGGVVEVESTPGRTCFTVRLPVSGPSDKVRSTPEGPADQVARG